MKAPTKAEIELASRLISRKRSESAACVHRPLCRQISSVGQSGGGERPKYEAFPINLNLRPPARSVLTHPEIARLVVYLCAPHILGVRLARHLAQVIKSVVVPDTVKVVNGTFGPFTRHPEPGKTVPPVQHTIYAHYDVSAGMNPASQCTYACIPGDLLQPSEVPGSRVIRKHLPETGMGEGRIRFVHCVGPLKTTWWEVTLRACKPWVLRNYTVGTSL